MDSECFEPNDPATITVGAILIVGGVISFLPQYAAIIKAKSSRGLSFITIGLSLSSNGATAVNGGMLEWSKWECCVTESLTVDQCLNNNLGTTQLFFAWVWLVVLYALFIIYCRPAKGFPPRLQKKRRYRALVCMVLVLLFTAVVVALAAILYYVYDVDSSALRTYADCLGYLSALLTSLQYMPQIYTTWALRGPGALSPATLGIQLFGQFLIVYFQAVQNEAAMSTWFPNIVSIFEMSILMSMLAYYRLTVKGTESRPLLQEETKIQSQRDEIVDLIFDDKEVVHIDETEGINDDREDL